MMTTEQIIELYKTECTGLIPIGNLEPKEYHSIVQLEKFIKDGLITDEEITKAFKKANESDFLCGKKNDFRAGIMWITNPANIEKINNGNYDDKIPKKRGLPKIQNHKVDYDELEKQIAKDNDEKLKKILADKSFWDSKINYWWKKYPNLRHQEIHRGF